MTAALPFSLGQGVVEALTATGLTLSFVWILLPFARRLGLVDHPGGRKDHDQPTAATGGLAMALAIILVMTLLTDITRPRLAFMLGGAFLVVVGMLDDLFDLRWWIRILAQCAAVLVMIYVGGVVIEHVGPIIGLKSSGLGALSMPFTVFATIGVINAINMSDGVDGLAGGISLGALCMLAVAAVYSGNWRLAEALIIFGGAVLGFLLVNMRFPWQPRARVFMGNAGSAFLGFMIAWASFRLTQNPAHPVTPVLAPWFVATPVIDCLSLIGHRLRRGYSPFRADRTHLHHLLLDSGFRPGQVTVLLVATNLLLGLLAAIAILCKVPQLVIVLAFVGLGAAYFWFSARHSRAIAAFSELRRLLVKCRFKPPGEVAPSAAGGED